MKGNLIQFSKTAKAILFVFLVNVAGTTKADAPVGAINGIFSVSENTQVYFSQGNLQYQASTNTWRFAENQYNYIGSANTNVSSIYSGWIDLFGWGTSGYHNSADAFNTNYYPYSTSTSSVNTSFNRYGYGPSTFMTDPNLTGTSANYDWGIYNPILNGNNTAGNWRVLTQSEWNYVLNTRTTTNGIRFAKARVNYVNGLILLPDNWSTSTYSLSNTNSNEASFNSNVISGTQWVTLENAGAVFLPAAGNRYGTSIEFVGSYCLYWSASYENSLSAYNLYCGNGSLSMGSSGRCYGLSVRLVSAVSTIPDPPVSGSNDLFSVSVNTQVYFSPGNLQYQASTNIWRFAENQWDYVGTQNPYSGNPGGTIGGSDNSNISSTYSGWIDLFCWGTSGYNHGANCYQPWSISTSNNDYYAYGNHTYNLYDQTGKADWGYNPIINGENTNNMWRTLSQSEWDYVFNTRITSSGIRFAKAQVNYVNGVILLPDDWSISNYNLNDVNNNNASFSSNVITISQWSLLETAGAIFLPAAGMRYGASITNINTYGWYWSASRSSSTDAGSIIFYASGISSVFNSSSRSYGESVRLVRTVQASSYNINVTPNPAEGGSVFGAGTYNFGETATLTAMPNEGFTFNNWTKNGELVSTEATYSFMVTENASYVANFGQNNYTITASANPTEGGIVSFNIFDFEDQQIPSNWTNDNAYPWIVSACSNGSFCMKSGNGGVHNSTSAIEITVDFIEDGLFSFDYNCQGEGTSTIWDKCKFDLDGINVFTYGANNPGWHTYSQPVIAGTHTFKWHYIKDGSVNPTGDAFFVDNVNLIGVGDGNPYWQGQTCTIMAMPNTGYTFTSWTENNEVVSTETIYSFIVSGDRNLVANFQLQNYTIMALTNPSEGGTASIAGCSYEFDFEDSTLQGWTSIDADGDGKFWIIRSEFDSNDGYNLYGHSGSFFMASFSFYDGDEFNPNNYFVSPEMTNASFIRYYVAGNYSYRDHYGIYSSTSGNTINDFNLVYEETIPEAKVEMTSWYERTVELPQGTKYVAFRHFNSCDQLFVLLDDITISTDGCNSFEHGQICTLTATPNQGYTFINWTKDGEEVSTEAVYSFIVTEEAEFVANFIPTAFHFTTSGLWSEASNWQGGSLPGVDDVVFIEANCQLDQNITVGSLTVSNGQSLTLQPDKTLTVTGDLTNTSTEGLVIKDGAKLINASGNVAATMEKDIAAYSNSNPDAWYTVASPMDEMPIEGSGFATPEFDLYRYNESNLTNEEWENYKGGLADFTTFENGRGYLFANSNAFSPAFTGTLNASAVSCPLSFTERPNDPLSGFNLIGNPFPHDIYKGVGAAIDDANLASGYYTLTNEGTWQVHTFEDAIHPGQGILVKATAPTVLTIAKSTAAATAETGGAKRETSPLSISVKGENGMDQAFVYFGRGNSMEKMGGFVAKEPSLWVRDNGKDYAIAHVEKTFETLELCFSSKQLGDFTLTVGRNETEFEYLQLVDHVTGLTVDLLKQPTYGFHVTGQEPDARFSIRFKVTE